MALPAPAIVARAPLEISAVDVSEVGVASPSASKRSIARPLAATSIARPPPRGHNSAANVAGGDDGEGEIKHVPRKEREKESVPHAAGRDATATGLETEKIYIYIHGRTRA